MVFLKIIKRASFAILLMISFLLIGWNYFYNSGLDNPEPIGKYLNFNFPSLAVDGPAYERIFSNLTFDSPLTFQEHPFENKIIVGQRNGKIYWFDKISDVVDKNLMLDLSNEVGVVWDGGFLGFALHPQFGSNGKNYFYTFYTTKDANGNDFPNYYMNQGCANEDYFGNFLTLARFETYPGSLDVIPGSKQTLLKLRMYGTTHRGGGLVFGQDGLLYLTTGDQTAFKKSQDIVNNLDGGVLRLDVDKNSQTSHPPVRKMPEDHGYSDEITGVGYWIPNDNPFLSPSGTNFEEYYTLGHRNPHRMTMDSETGKMYIGEIGGGRHEEINVLSRGKNYGWPLYEGLYRSTFCVQSLYNNMAHEEPLVAFPRSEANAVIGGFVYRGSIMPELKGKYICADYGIGEEIWAVDTDTGTYEQLGDFTSTNVISFGQDNEGELYILKQGVDNLYRMISKSGSSPALPRFLSETGAFENLSTLEPVPGLVEYDLIAPFWSDGAIKKRWLAVPNDGTHNTIEEKIAFSENDVWTFPVGSVLVKHFELPIDESDPTITKRLETRFSVKGEDNFFYFVTYKWNDQQTDAELLATGLDQEINITRSDGSTTTQTWHYPSKSECISCHNQSTGGTLGARTRYLNKNITYEKTGINANQLVTLSHLGMLDADILDADTSGFLTTKALDDPNATSYDKARSYMDLNCAYCHHTDNVNRADFDLRLGLSLYETGLLDATTNTPLGIPNEKIFVAGEPNTSILYHRVNSTEQGEMMPPLAKNEVDDIGVALLYQWIDNLDWENSGNTAVVEAYYTIESKMSGKILEVADESNADGANVRQWQETGNSNQKFLLERGKKLYYRIKAGHSDKYVEVANGSATSSSNVSQNQGDGTDVQEWYFEDAGDGYYFIINKSNGLFLNLENGSDENGANIGVGVKNMSDTQKWKINTVDLCPPAGTACDDGDSNTTDDVEDGNCNCAGTPLTSGTEICVTISASANDVEEKVSNGNINMFSSDLELISDTEAGGGEQIIGLRFENIAIPNGSFIEKAYIQFTTDEVGTGPTDLVIKGEAVDDATAFVSSAYNVSGRGTTSASVDWSPSAWDTQGDSGVAEKTPELKTLVQEIVNRPGFNAGNSIAFIITGSGKRTAESYDGSVQSAPKLCIVYSEGCPPAGTQCDDGDSGTTDDVEDGNCNCAGTPTTSTTACALITSRYDDVEELNSNGSLYTHSSDLELVDDGGFVGGVQTIGLRFTNLNMPQGAVVESAYLQFTTDEVGTGPTNLTIKGENVDTAGAFVTNTYNVSGRVTTSASVDWSPPEWDTQGESGAAQKTPNLKSIVQEIVNRPGFGSNSAMAFIITGSGKRTAESYDGSAQSAPLLCITYSGGNTSNSLKVNIDNRLYEEERFDDIAIYPNPTAGILTLDLGNYEDTALQFTVFNAMGQVVHEVYLDKMHKRIERLSLEKLSDGVYTVAVQSERGNSFSKKIVLIKN